MARHGAPPLLCGSQLWTGIAAPQDAAARGVPQQIEPQPPQSSGDAVAGSMWTDVHNGLRQCGLAAVAAVILKGHTFTGDAVTRSRLRRTPSGEGAGAQALSGRSHSTVAGPSASLEIPLGSISLFINDFPLVI